MPITKKDQSLDKFMIPNIAPAAQTGSAMSGFAFGQNIERDAISRNKIQNLSIGSAQIGTAVITSVHVSNIDVSKINAGTINVGWNLGSTVGGAYIKLDGVNNRIIVNDGTVNRIVIGSV